MGINDNDEEYHHQYGGHAEHEKISSVKSVGAYETFHSRISTYFS